DLAVIAAEWGYGRREGWLSNLHLAARDPRTGGLVMLGKTFKGLTDKMLTWQTEQFLEREARRTKTTVYVDPPLVAEGGCDGVQRTDGQGPVHRVGLEPLPGGRRPAAFPADPGHDVAVVRPQLVLGLLVGVRHIAGRVHPGRRRSGTELIEGPVEQVGVRRE